VAHQRGQSATQESTHLALKVIITSEQQPPGNRCGDRGNTTEDRFRLEIDESDKEPPQKKFKTSGLVIAYPIKVQLPVCTDIKEPAGSIVGSCNKGVSVGEELDGINVGLMPGERLDGLAGANVPELGESIASTGDKSVLVRWVEADAHDISKMVGELNHLGAGFDIPLHAGHITGRGDDAAVVDEAAAR